MNLKKNTGMTALRLTLVFILLLWVSLGAFAAPVNPPDPAPSSSPAMTEAPSPTPSATEAPSPAPSAEPASGQPQDQLSEAVSAMAKIQVLLEYFYMEMGEYPSALQEMEEMFNTRIPEHYEKITIPLDPATKKVFRYEVKNKGGGYLLSLPDASKYGTGQLKLSNISWGWMKRMAGEERKDSLLTNCKNTLSGLATTIEVCAYDRKGKYPVSLSLLIPLYMNSIPRCPLCHKEYVYRFKGNKYEISCPAPELHGLKSLKYISNEGLKYEK